MSIQMTKAALLEALQAKRAEAETFDTNAAKRHAADEKAWVKEMRSKLRAAAKITTYEEMSVELCQTYRNGGMSTSVQPGSWPDRPTCPRLLTLPYDRAIEQVQLDSRKRFTLADTGQSSNLHRLVTQDLTPRASTVCD